jgi:hypothetical protein
MLINNDELLIFSILPNYILQNWDEKITIEYQEYKVYKSSLYSIYFNEKKKKFLIYIDDSILPDFIKYYLNLAKNQSIIKDYDILFKKIAYYLAINRL